MPPERPPSTWPNQYSFALHGQLGGRIVTRRGAHRPKSLKWDRELYDEDGAEKTEVVGTDAADDGARLTVAGSAGVGWTALMGVR